MASDSENTGSPVAWQDVLERIDGDDELLLDLINIFLDDTPAQIRKLQAALDAGDMRVAERLAHSIKGASANMGVKDLCSAAYAGEMAAKQDNLDGAKQAYLNIEREYRRAESAMRQRLDAGGKACEC